MFGADFHENSAVSIKILLVEDESSIADALTFSLGKEGYTTKTAATARQAIREVEAFAPALVILDIGLPDASGFDVCKAIRKVSNLPLLFLTARSEEVDKVMGLELGADDYMSKPFSTRELIARVRALLRRSAATVSAAPEGHPRFLVDKDRYEILFDGKSLNLSRYEYRLFVVLLSRPGRVFSREELMNRAWETPEMSLERTVDTHIKTIRAKLRLLSPSEEFVVTHRGLGYSLKEAT